MTTENNEWHLDRRVPISLILAILLQTASFVWVIAQIDGKLDETVRRTEALEGQVDERRSIVEGNRTDIAVIKSSINHVNQTLLRIEAKLDERQ